MKAVKLLAPCVTVNAGVAGEVSDQFSEMVTNSWQISRRKKKELLSIYTPLVILEKFSDFLTGQKYVVFSMSDRAQFYT